jgi:predicted nuclease of predicted toxin-antitoxin system
MKIKLDENLPAGLVDLLRSAKFDVATAVEESLGGAKDALVTAAIKREGRLFMTYDLDFADIRKHPSGSHAGIVVFRLQDQRWRALEGPARRLVKSGLLERLHGRLAIVDEVRVRTRSEKKPRN